MAAQDEFPVSQLLTYGDPRGTVEWPDYLALGLTAEHIPALIGMATDTTLLGEMAEPQDEPQLMDFALLGQVETPDDEVPLKAWAPIHAWRALGQLHAESAIEPLIGLWHEVGEDQEEDDWLLDDLPEALGMIGAPAVPSLIAYLTNRAHDSYPRSAAVLALRKAADFHPELRDEVVRQLTKTLEEYDDNGDVLNASLVGELVRLHAVEAATIIKAAYYADKVDTFLTGSWPDVKEGLGLDPDAEVPGPEPEMNELRPMFEEIFGTADPYAPSSPRPLKLDRKVKAKRKQEKKSRKQNRPRKKKK